MKLASVVCVGCDAQLGSLTCTESPLQLVQKLVMKLGFLVVCIGYEAGFGSLTCIESALHLVQNLALKLGLVV
jgi:hypothetical protein